MIHIIFTSIHRVVALIVISLMTFLCVPRVNAENVIPQTRPPAREQSFIDADSFTVLLERGRRYSRDGELVRAQEIYQRILASSIPATLSRDEIAREAQDINIKIIFSRIQTDDSFFYKVEKGDSLYKIAKKFKTTIELLKKVNGLTTSRIYPDQELKVIKGTFSVVVSKADNTLKLNLNGHLVKTYTVATGKKNLTPTGEFEIINKLKNPTWFHAGAVVPPDSPKNILGTRWLGFDVRGYGIHGTTVPESIGTHSTAGCIRMYNQEVEELYAFLPVGTKVKVVD